LAVSLVNPASEMTYIVSSGALNSTHLWIHTGYRIRRLRKSLWDRRTSTRSTTYNKISDIHKWNDASTASGPLWAMRSLNVQLASVVSYVRAFVLEADILSSCY